jgi:hypothetical protein
MFTGSLSDGTRTIPIYDAQQERQNVEQQNTPLANALSKATALALSQCNSISDSDQGAHAYVLVLKSDLDTLNLNGTFTLTFALTMASGWSNSPMPDGSARIPTSVSHARRSTTSRPMPVMAREALPFTCLPRR